MESAATEAGTGGGGGGRDGAATTTTKKAAACDVAALRKCLEENKGDRAKCQDHIDAFRSSCSINPSPPPPPHARS